MPMLYHRGSEVSFDCCSVLYSYGNHNSVDHTGHVGIVYSLTVLKAPGKMRLFSASYDKTIRVSGKVYVYILTAFKSIPEDTYVGMELLFYILTITKG